jgi:hypothetical protein|tara:strand:- start:156 stop:410 length:255 start_codon:yes stop_codon:yes gene_type:complete
MSGPTNPKLKGYMHGRCYMLMQFNNAGYPEETLAVVQEHELPRGPLPVVVPEALYEQAGVSSNDGNIGIFEMTQYLPYMEGGEP